MGRKLYTAADHQRAFEVYYESDNLARSAQVLGCEYTTIRDWMVDTYKCKYNCPWHGWQRLKRERQAALDARFKLLEEGNVDPVAHGLAISTAVEGAKTLNSDYAERRKQAIDAIVRSDLERISHLELLYGKIFYQATGIPVDHAGIHDAPGIDRDAQMEALYKKSALKATNLESAIKAMISLTEHIKKLHADLGITKPGARPTQVIEEPEAEQADVTEELTIDELRRFRELIEHTAPDKIDLLKKIMRADDESVKAILGGQKQTVVEAVVLPPPPPEVPVSSV